MVADEVARMLGLRGATGDKAAVPPTTGAGEERFGSEAGAEQGPEAVTAQTLHGSQPCLRALLCAHPLGAVPRKEQSTC